MTIQAPGEPLLDNESTRGDERVSRGQRSGCVPRVITVEGRLGSTREVASESTWVGTQWAALSPAQSEDTAAF